MFTVQPQPWSFLNRSLLVKLAGCTLLATAAAWPQTGSWTIDTFAGQPAAGDGGPAVSARLRGPQGLTLDGSGNLYFADTSNHRIRKVDTSGVITTIAGTGEDGFGGDGGPAVSALLNHPHGVAVDGAGNVYISDRGNHRIRKVDTSGVITTVAGTGEFGFGGDGGPAVSAQLRGPLGLTLDGSGNLYFADTSNHRIRKVDTSGVITTVAGTGVRGFGGDGGQAVSAQLRYPNDVALDGSGNFYIADTSNHRIRKVDTSGVITTVAGTGVRGFGGDGGPGAEAQLAFPYGVALDSGGNLYIADDGNDRIRKVDTTGVITTVAGDGTEGFSGDGGQAVLAQLRDPNDVALDGSGNFYIADDGNNRIRKVDTSGVITTVAGTDDPGHRGDGGAAVSALLVYPNDVATDGAGNLYICSSVYDGLIRKVDSLGVISTIAGPVTEIFNRGRVPAIVARLKSPYGVATDAAGNFYIADRYDHVIRKVDTSGVITTIAGTTGTTAGGFSGDGGPAAEAQLAYPYGVATDSAGNLYIADAENDRIRKVDTSGKITTFAGDGTASYGGDGGQAISAQLHTPYGVATDGAGNVYIADTYNHRIRKVDSSGVITTIAGTGEQSFGGDGGQAVSAQLQYPRDVAVDGAGNVYIADTGNHRVRKVDSSGVITTVAGTGEQGGFGGDGGQAVSAQLRGPHDVAVDGAGNIYIADTGNHRVRKVDSSGIITTAAGDGTEGFGGDGGQAIAARFDRLSGVATDGAGNVYIADTENQRIRKVDTMGIITTVAGGDGGGDGAPAAYALLRRPSGVEADRAGNVYIADTGNYRIRKVDSTGIITTIAGTARYGSGGGAFGGDGGPAISAQLGASSGVATDGVGNLYIADWGNYRIRKVDTTGVITTVAGTGASGFGGDGGPAVSALLGLPYYVAVDAAGNLYIADRGNHRIRKVDTMGIITTIAGDGTRGYGGDDGPAVSAQLNNPYGVTVDAAGNVYIGDTGNHRIRKVDTVGVITTIAGTGESDFGGDGGPAIEAQLQEPRGLATDSAGNLYVADTGNGRIRILRPSENVILPPPPPSGGGGGGPTVPSAPRNLTAVGGDGLAVLRWDAPENDGGTEITDYEYRTDRSNPWISTGSTNTSHTVTGLVNGTTYVFQVRAVNSIGNSSASNQAEATPAVTGDRIYYFPHLAVGESWQTTITLINYSLEEVSCQTDFLSDQGDPLMISFPSWGPVVSRIDELPPGGSVHEETDVELSAPLAAGWARATCSGPVKASLLFRQYDSAGVPLAEAGVNATSVPAKRFITFAEQAPGQVGTGVAYANPSDTAAVVTFSARDETGRMLPSVNQTLMPNEHGAQNMAGLFTRSSFTGSLEITSTEPIVSLSINAEAPPIFSSLPPGEPDASAQGPTSYYFPHLAVGASWQTTITYINYSSQEVSCRTDFLSSQGTPLTVSFPGLGAVTSRSDALPPGGSVHEETDVGLSAPAAAGWARAACSGPVKASLLFRQYDSAGAPTGEAGVNAAAAAATRFVTFAEQAAGQPGTGVAYANPSDTAAVVTFTARDEAGRTLDSVDRTLMPGEHGAQNMAGLFGLPSFTGSLEISSTVPIVTLSLNAEAAPVFSSLPPGELDAADIPGEIPVTGTPDLVVQALSVSDSSPNAGESFTLSATVRNQGQGPSAITTLHYYRSSDTMITTSDMEVAAAEVAELAASGSSSQSVQLTAPATPGKYNYGACVDAVADEAATANNCSKSVLITVSEPQGGTATDREALVEFYHLTGGPDWINRTNWLSDAPLGEWFGVDTDSNGRVTSLALTGNDLSGTIPPELGDLTNLQLLILWSNQLSGPIPPELANLTSLQELDLQGNQLSGSIHPELGDLANLQVLNLSRNQLSGPIPPELAHLVSLQRLDFFANLLSGPIPSELGKLASLQSLWLGVNQLSGSIPSELADMTALQELDLRVNQLSGSIPPQLGDLASLQWLHLAGNQLSGSIPPELADLTGLEWLFLFDNQLSGSIPPELGELTGLQELNLWTNQLSGSIPPELTRLTSLRVLFLGGNLLSGSIPPQLGALSGLQELHLGGNLLSGPIPPQLGKLASLQFLFLGGNQLSGSIPPELGALSGLQELHLGGNLLSGSISPELANLSSLEILNLSVNQLSGMVPRWLQQLPLKVLNLMATSLCDPEDAGLEQWRATIEYLPSGITCGQPLSEMSTIDVAIFYTPAARRRAGGTAEIEAKTDLMIAEANRAYEESGVDQQIVLDAREEVRYVEEGGSGHRALNRLADPSDGYMDEIHAIRDRAGADLVNLIADVTDLGGAARLPGVFSVICADGCNVNTFAHELGHNMGLSHERYIARGGLFPYSYGYVNQRAFAADAGASARWNTIMAYGTQCSDEGFWCNLILRFSNPNQRYLGDPLGVPGDEETYAVTGPADAVRALNSTRHSVAAFRKPSSEKRLSMFDSGSAATQVSPSPGAAVGSGGVLFKAIASKGRDAASLLSGGEPDTATLRRREVTVDIGLLDRVSAAGTSTTLMLNLFDDFVLLGVIEKRRPTFSGGYALSGRLAGVAGGTVTLVINGSVVAGAVRLPTATYRIRPAGVGRHAIIQVDPSQLPQGCETVAWPLGRDQ